MRVIHYIGFEDLAVDLTLLADVPKIVALGARRFHALLRLHWARPLALGACLGLLDFLVFSSSSLSTASGYAGHSGYQQFRGGPPWCRSLGHMIWLVWAAIRVYTAHSIFGGGLCDGSRFPRACVCQLSIVGRGNGARQA